MRFSVRFRSNVCCAHLILTNWPKEARRSDVPFLSAYRVYDWFDCVASCEMISGCLQVIAVKGFKGNRLLQKRTTASACTYYPQKRP